MTKSHIIGDKNTVDVIVFERCGNESRNIRLIPCGNNFRLAESIFNSVNRPGYATLRIKKGGISRQ